MRPEFAVGSALLYVLASGIRSGAPIVLASVGGCFSAQVRVFNIALEGMMMAGAFAGFAASDHSGSAIVGLAAGIGAGPLVAVLIAICCGTVIQTAMCVQPAATHSARASALAAYRNWDGSASPKKPLPDDGGSRKI